MIRIFKTEDGAMHEKEEMQPGCWIALTNPTASEIIDIADTYQIDPDHLRAPLDEEERSRIEVEDEYTLILVDIPSIEERNGKDWFVTIPLAIITTKDVLITVCLEETPVLTSFMDGRVRDFHTFMKTRFILQILYKNATQFLQYLRIIDKKSEVIERKLHQSPCSSLKTCCCVDNTVLRSLTDRESWRSRWYTLPPPFVPTRWCWKSCCALRR